MTREELEAKVKEICPEMLSHEKFMHAAECVFCKEIPNDSGPLDAVATKAWFKISEKLRSATVAQVIAHLQKNFNPDDKLCYMDCVQGCRNDCTYVTKDQLGQRFFYYVKTLEKNIPYPYVDDNDVVVA